MSNRIEKRMGYGVTVTPEDPRVDWDRLELFWDKKQMKQAGITRESLREYGKKMAEENPRWKHNSVGVFANPEAHMIDTVTAITAEDGMPDDQVVVLITPPMIVGPESRMRDTLLMWSEYDATYPELAKEGMGHVLTLPAPPFPYSEELLDTVHGVPVHNDDARRFVRSGPFQDPMFDFLLLEGTRFKTLEELKAETRLLPPRDVQLYARYLGLFTDDEMVEALEPMIVTFFR